jgi:hypothetical protein
MADEKEKDRLGDKLRDKERGEEEKFFQEREKALLDKLRHRPAADDGRMRCPRDATALASVHLYGVTVDECPSCGGVWMDKRDLEKIARRDQGSWIGRLLSGQRK